MMQQGRQEYRMQTRSRTKQQMDAIQAINEDGDEPGTLTREEINRQVELWEKNNNSTDNSVDSNGNKKMKSSLSNMMIMKVNLIQVQVGVEVEVMEINKELRRNQ
ncbi:MAG: hypothetical protein EZS28_051734 [Streblomastix strix]|uniref:Uncharacterized protein n=1 Tax=Streblomastix strix TaxID=222440 RepID=A0A5J4T2L1_9EUKA|nr:MAG: hypothetical protein EZS28_051734 [Streblomastix strix]